MLVVGLKEKSNLFPSLEYKAEGEDKPSQSVDGRKDGPVNFTRTTESSVVYGNVPDLENENVCASLIIKGGRFTERSGDNA